jgi:hypothetical protein
MIRRTYGDCKAELARVAGASGMGVADSRLKTLFNLATEELMNEGDWPSLTDRLMFWAYDQIIVLPADYERILVCTVNTVPQQMHSSWFEYVGFGPSTLFGSDLLNSSFDPDTQMAGILDHSERCTFASIPGDQVYYAQVVGSVDERTAGVRPRAIIRGYDTAGNWVRSLSSGGSYIDGIELEINGDTMPLESTSSQDFSVVTGFIKPATKGYVYLNAVNLGLTATESIGTYAPKETNPSYRSYKLAGPTSTDPVQVRALVRRRYVPVDSDNDFVLITNLPALESMMMAINSREAKQWDNFTALKGNAIDLLKKEASTYRGPVRKKPLITFTEGTGVRSDAMYVQ